VHLGTHYPILLKSCGRAFVPTDMQAEHSRLALNQVHRSALDEKCFVAAICAYGEVIYLPAISCCTEVIPQFVQLSSVRIILFKADGSRMGTANFLSVSVCDACAQFPAVQRCNVAADA
jgi:hypothetical protein